MKPSILYSLPLIFAPLIMAAPPAAAEECAVASLANKGTYVLHFRAYGHNEKCSATTKYDVAGAGSANFDVVSGNTIEITGVACISEIAKCHYTVVCDNDQNSCDDIVCDGVFPASLHCERN